VSRRLCARGPLLSQIMCVGTRPLLRVRPFIIAHRYIYSHSQSVPMVMVTAVSGAPTLKYSQKLIDTPRDAAFCTTIRFAIEPRTVKLPASVEAIATTSQAVSWFCSPSMKGFMTSTAGTAFATQATALLFGNVLAVDVSTVWTLLALGVVSVTTLAVISRPLLFASLQPEVAEARGVSLRLYSVLFLALVALATAECAQIVGVLLVFTLMVGPAAAAQRLTSGVGKGVLLSAALALCEAWLGITLAFYTDWPSSFWITALSAGVYLLTALPRPAWAKHA
jgi:ABC-type Fe3+-siderophore transport system permease subunit